MNNTMKLLQVYIRSTFGLSVWKYRIHEKKGSKLKTMLYVLLGLCLIPNYYVFCKGIQFVYNITSPINQQSILLSFGIVGIILVLLIFGVMYVFSAFFSADDTELLMSYPVKPRSIVYAKTLNIVLIEYLFVIPLFLPLLIQFGINEQFSLMYIVNGLIIMLLLPVVPVAVCTMISLFFTRVFAGKLNKEKVQTILMCLILVGCLGLNYFISNSAQGSAGINEMEWMQNMVENNLFLAEGASAAYPIGLWATRALLNPATLNGLVNLLLFMGISVLILVCCVEVGSYFFTEAVLSGKGNNKRAKKLSVNDRRSFNRLAKPYLSVFQADLKTILRTPIYAFNTYGIVPILLICGGISMASMQMNFAQLELLYRRFVFSDAALACTGALIGGMAGITATAFSREGTSYWLSQTIPATGRDQLLGKSLSAYLLIGFIAITLSAMILLVGGSLYNIVIVNLLLLLISFPIITGQLLLDLYHPWLSWDDPAKAVKQNINVIIGMLATMVFIMLLCGIFYLLYLKLQWSYLAVLGLIAVICIGCGVLLYQWFCKVYNQRLLH